MELLGLLATIVRIVLMYYLNLEKFLNQPECNLKIMLAEASDRPEVLKILRGLIILQKVSPTSAVQRSGTHYFMVLADSNIIESYFSLIMMNLV